MHFGWTSVIHGVYEIDYKIDKYHFIQAKFKSKQKMTNVIRCGCPGKWVLNDSSFEIRLFPLMTLFAVSRLNDGRNIVSLRIEFIDLHAEEEIWLAAARQSTAKH